MNIDEALDGLFSESLERPLEDSCRQPKRPDDVELIISILETLIDHLKRRSNNAGLNNPLSSNSTGILQPPIGSSAYQKENITQPAQTFLEPSKPHYTDISCSSLIPNVKLSYGE